MQDNLPSWAFRTSAPIQIERRRLDDEPDLAPDAAVVGAFVEGRLIARCAASQDWTPDHDQGLLDTPRVIEYIAQETDGGVIRAEICAIIPAAELIREPWEPEPDADAPVGLVLLGVVVRLAHDRSGAEFTTECLDHFLQIMQVGAESVVDRLLKSV